MTEEKANKLAELLHIEGQNTVTVWHSGGGIWLVYVIATKTGTVAVFSDELVMMYPSWEAAYNDKGENHVAMIPLI